MILASYVREVESHTCYGPVMILLRDGDGLIGDQVLERSDGIMTGQRWLPRAA